MVIAANHQASRPPCCLLTSPPARSTNPYSNPGEILDHRDLLGRRKRQAVDMPCRAKLWGQACQNLGGRNILKDADEPRLLGCELEPRPIRYDRNGPAAERHRGPIQPVVPWAGDEMTRETKRLGS